MNQKRYLYFLAFLLLKCNISGFTQHRIFMSKPERVRMIDRLSRELNLLAERPASFTRDTAYFWKLDTFYVQWGQLNSVLKPMLAMQSVVKDSLWAIAVRNNWEEGKHFAMIYAAQSLAYRDRRDSAYVLLLDIKKGFEHLKLPYQQAWVNIMLAEQLAYREIISPSEPEKAKQYVEDALAIGHKYKYWDIIHKANAYLGDIYLRHGAYAKAVPYFEKQQVIFKQHGKINLGYYSEGANFAHLGICYLHLEGEEKALYYFNKFYQNNDPNEGAYANYLHHMVLSEFSEYYIKRKEFKKALEFEKLYVAILSQRSQQDYARHYEHLYAIYKGLGNFETSLYYYEKWQTVRDKLKTEKLSQNFKRIESLYQLEKKNNEIEELRKMALEKEIDKQKNTIIVIVTAFCFTIVLFGLLLRSVNLKKSITQVQLKLLQQNQQIARQIIHTQESEQQRIAGDLHDDLGGMLATVNAKLSQLTSAHSLNDIRKGIVDVLSVSAKAGDLIRRISHNLLPPDLEKTGMVALIQERINQLNDVEKTAFHCQVVGQERRLSTDQEVNIYRILSELIHNIQKHAQAQSASIQFFFHFNSLTVTVEDDGSGNKASKTRENNWGIGLKNVHFRVKYLQGRLSVETDEQGTTILLEVPYEFTDSPAYYSDC